MALSKEDREEIVEIIQLTVNGKIDRLDERIVKLCESVQAHQEEVKPFMDGWRGAKVFGNLAKWIAGVAIAIAAIVTTYAQLR